MTLLTPADISPQFEELWSHLPVNEFGNLDYGSFLSGFGGPAAPPERESDPQELPVQQQPEPTPATSEAQPSSAIFAHKNGATVPDEVREFCSLFVEGQEVALLRCFETFL